MINQVRKKQMTQEKKLPNNLILVILEYLKPNKVGQCLLLNKMVSSSLSRKFHTYFFSVTNACNVILHSEDLKEDSLMKNVRITIKIAQENKKSNLFMLQIFKNDKERLGVVPLLYNKSNQTHIVNINENRYSSLFFLLRSKKFDSMKFNLELITSNVNDILSKETTLSILYFKNS